MVNCIYALMSCIMVETEGIVCLKTWLSDSTDSESLGLCSAVNYFFGSFEWTDV